MNRIIVSLLILLTACSSAFAASVAAPETPAILVNDSGGDTRTLPLPVTETSAASMAEFIGPLPTPTIAMATTVANTTASFTAAADRLYVMIQNHDTATSLWVAPAVTATMSEGIEVLPQSHILRPWGSSVPVSYIASEVISLTIEQGVLP